MNFPINFKLDEEFRQRNRPLTKQERSNLERLIEQEQCADGALTVALLGTEKILCDGYNTLAICQEKGVAPAEPRYLPFKDRAAVLEWMDLRQRARRNLTPEQMAENRAARIERVAEARAEGKTTREIAKAEGVSQKTIVADIEKASTDTGVSVEPPNGKITGKDGRTRTARPKKPKPKAAPEPRWCERCTRMRVQRPDCPQCEELNKGPAPKSSAKGPSVSITEPFDVQFEKLYDALLLLLDRRKQKMGTDKCFTACLNAAFECRKHYKAWVSA